MAEQRVTGSSQRNAKDVAYELTELYYTTVVNKESKMFLLKKWQRLI